MPEFWPKGLCASCAFEDLLDPADATAESPKIRFGDYELIEQVGRGGMGIVYRARQVSLNRTVALKMLQGGQFATKQEVLRFRSEAEAAANLQHQNIVSVHETGEREGQHYFSMDYIHGRTLAELVHEGPLAAHRSARYARLIAEAIEYAHSQGVLHRDLKPSNVLIDASDQPRITDFGLAKRVRGDFGLTVSGQVLGSPNFMPPEQTAGKGGKVGPASDVYGIGALLYHLLTGRPPFQAESIEEVLLLLRESDPVSPRLLNASVPRDLETICLKCLQKQPERRYQSAQELADELGCFLRSEPIQARPVTIPEKLVRWVSRKPLIASLILLVNLLAAGAILGILSQWQRAERSAAAERRERNAAQSANRNLQQVNSRLAETISLLELQRAEDRFTARDAASGVAHLVALLRHDPSNHVAANRLVSALTHRDWALPSLPPLWHSNRVTMVSFSPSTNHILSASWDGTARIWDAATGEIITTLSHEGAVLSARYSADGRHVLTASADKTARIWNAQTGLPVSSLLPHNALVHSAEFSQDGRLALTASADQSARIWETSTGELKQALAGHESIVRQARFSSEAQWVATGTQNGTVRIWSTQSGKLLHRIDGVGRVESLAFSPNGLLLAAVSDDRQVRLWNPLTGEPIGHPFPHSDDAPSVWHLTFSPDSRFLLTAAEEGTARIWDVATGRAVGQPLSHESGVNFGAFSPDSQFVVTTSTDNTSRLWDARLGLPLFQPLRQIERVVRAGFSADGQRLVTASYDGIVQIWSIASSRSLPLEAFHSKKVNSVVFHPAGKLLLSTSDHNTALLSDTTTGRALGEPIAHPAPVLYAEFSPDGDRFVTACRDGVARVWDLRSRRMLAAPLKHAKTIWSARFSPDGTRISTASADGTARVWDAQSGKPISPPLTHANQVWVARFSPDGRLVATASDDATARVWNVLSGEPLTPPLIHVDHVKWVEFSPDGERLLTTSSDRTARLWNSRTGEPLIAPLEHPRAVARATFSPDGMRIASASLDRTARIWDARTGQTLTPPLRHDTPVSQVQFSRDGRRLLTVSWNFTAKVWDPITGQPLTEELKSDSFIFSATFDPAGLRVALGTDNGLVPIWDLPLAPVPVPPAFLDFAETLAGIRLSPRGNIELVERHDFNHLPAKFFVEDASNFYARLQRWFIASPDQRAPLGSIAP